MSENRILLDAAAFLDSPQAISISAASTEQIREITQRFLAACYDGIGKAPKLLDGDELAGLLRDVLPRYFGVKDALAAATEEVVSAYVEFLIETEMVPHSFELRSALGMGAAAFLEVVASGAAHGDGIAVTGKGKTIRNRGEKVGRNDPCPCGSGKKFKKCCLRLGE